MTSTMVQHPIARIQAIIGELQDAIEIPAYEAQRVAQLWQELDDHIVMLASPPHTEILRKANAYDQIAGIINPASPPTLTGRLEATDADTDEASGRGHSDRGSGDGLSPGDQAGSGATRGPGSETD